MRKRPWQERGASQKGKIASSVASEPSETVLIIFAKAPIPGQVKTRLCPPLSPDEAASLHGSFVLDILEQTRSAKEVDSVIACAPSKDHPFFQTVSGRYGVQLWDQVGQDLGERMDHAFHNAFQRGYRRAMLIGTDIPMLQASTLRESMTFLTAHSRDLVLGPTVDGGYYLIGLTKPVSELFEDIPWSTKDVLSKTKAKAEALGLSFGVLDQIQDVDTIDDLLVLMKESRGAGQKNLSIRTSGVLRTLSQRLSRRQSLS